MEKENSTEKKSIKVCIGAYAQALDVQCTEKVKKLKAAGFKDAKAAAGGNYLYVVAGEYPDKEKAAAAMAKLKELGFNGYEANI